LHTTGVLGFSFSTEMSRSRPVQFATLYNAAPTIKKMRSIMLPLSRPRATSTNEGLIGRAREDHRFGFRRANIFRHYKADLGLLLAALGAQQRHHPKHFSFAIPDRGGREGEVLAATSRDTITQHI